MTGAKRGTPQRNLTRPHGARLYPQEQPQQARRIRTRGIFLNRGHSLVLGADGTIAGGCPTSGLSGKLPGRVGDSPILGSGLYVDNEVGAAGATGVGENVMRYCGTFLVVELMRQGLTPTEACLEALRRIAQKDPRGEALQISFVALDKHGRFGAGTAGQGFPYSVTTPTFSQVLTSRGLGELKQVPEGGNRP